MNGQAQQRWEWKDIVEDTKISINNAEISLELLKAKLKEAQAHARGK